MLTLGDIAVFFKGNTDDIDATMSRVVKNAENAGKQAESGFLAGLSNLPTKLGDFFTGAFQFAVGGLLTSGIEGLLGAVANGIGSVFSFATESRQSILDLQAALGVTREEAESLGAVARDVFAGNWGDSLAEVNAAVIEVQQQFAGLGGIGADATQEIVQGAFAIRDSFGADTNETISAARTLMEQFGISSTEALNFVTSGFQKGLNSSGDFLESIGEYSTQFANGGASAGQFFSALETGLGSGVLGTDKAADAFKEFTLRIADGSKTTADGLKAIGLSADTVANQIANGELTKADVFGLVIERLRAMDDSVARDQAGVALLGTQYEDMGAAAVLAMDLANTSIDDLAGATDSLNVKYENWPALWEGVRRSALVALEPLGAKLLDIANTAMPLVQAGLSWLGDTLPGLIDRATAAFAPFVAAGQQIYNAFAPLASDIATIFNGILTILDDVASSFFDWGNAAVAQYANGIASGVGWVADALSAIAETVSYWLEPQSPPRILPDIDQWGLEAAQIYMEGWNDPSLFESVQNFGKTLGTALENLADQGQAGGDALTLLVGSRQAFADALNELETTGDVSESTFERIRAAAGGAGNVAERLARAYISSAKATKELQAAQQALANTNGTLEAEQARLLQAQEAGDRTGIAQAQNAIAAAKAQQQAARQRVTDAQKQKKAADDQIKKEQQVQQFQRDQLNLLRQIAEAQDRAAKAQEKALGGKKQGESPEARKAREAKEAQEKYNYSLLDTQGKIDFLRDKQSKYNQTQKEYWDIAGQIRDLEAQKAREQERNTKAQDDYNFSLLDTEGQIEALKKKQSQYTQDQAEYWQIQGQIDSLQKKQADEQLKAQKEQEKKQQDLAQAQWDHAYAVASTAEKLQMLKDKLATLNPQQKEYYDTLTKIAQVEDQLAKENKPKGGGGAKKPKAGGGGARPGVPGGGIKRPEIKRPEIQRPTTGPSPAEQRDNAGGLPEVATRLQQKIQELGNSARQLAAAFVPVQAILTTVGGAFQTAGQAIMQYILPPLQTLGPQLETAMSAFTGIGPQFNAMVSSVLPVIKILSDYFIQLSGLAIGGLVSAISGALPGAFLLLSGVLTAAMGIVQFFADSVTGYVNVLVKLFSGDLVGAWEAWQAMWRTLGADILQVVLGLVEGVTGLISAVVDGVIGLFTYLWDELVGHSIVPDMVTGILQWFTDLKDQAIAFIMELVNGAIEWFTTFATDISTTISTFVADSITAITQFKDDAIAGFTDLVNGAIEQFTTWRDTITDIISTFVTDRLADIQGFTSDVIQAFTDMASDAYNSGTAFVQNLWDGFSDRWEQFWQDFTGKLQEYRNMLPFSEPKDHSSPLYGLGKSGAALIGMLQSGMDRAGGLQVPGLALPDVGSIGGAIGALGGMVFNAPLIGQATIREEADIQKLAYQLAKEIKRHQT